MGLNLPKKEAKSLGMRGSIAIAVLLAAFFTSQVCSGQSGFKHPVIRGGVELSEHLSPLNERLKPGVTFSEGLLPKGKQAGRWIRIPAWLAGGWRHDREITLFQRDEKTGLESEKTVPRELAGSERWGFQQDSEKQFWDYLHCGYTTFSHSTHLDLYNHVTDYDVWSSAPEKVVVRSRSILTTVNSQSGRIVSCSQREQLKVYRPLNENLLQITAYIRNFDRQGKASSLARNVIVERRIAMFTPLDEYGKENMKTSFHRFLKKNGLKKLIPPKQR